MQHSKMVPFIYNLRFTVIELGMEKIIKEIKLARGILFKNDSILLVQDIRPGQGHFFLPGGNVDPG